MTLSMSNETAADMEEIFEGLADDAKRRVLDAYALGAKEALEQAAALMADWENVNIVDEEGNELTREQAIRSLLQEDLES